MRYLISPLCRVTLRRSPPRHNDVEHHAEYTKHSDKNKVPSHHPISSILTSLTLSDTGEGGKGARSKVQKRGASPSQKEGAMRGASEGPTLPKQSDITLNPHSRRAEMRLQGAQGYELAGVTKESSCAQNQN